MLLLVNCVRRLDVLYALIKAKIVLKIAHIWQFRVPKHKTTNGTSISVSIKRKWQFCRRNFRNTESVFRESFYLILRLKKKVKTASLKEKLNTKPMYQTAIAVFVQKRSLLRLESTESEDHFTCDISVALPAPPDILEDSTLDRRCRCPGSSFLTR